jgi:hypothetical protein
VRLDDRVLVESVSYAASKRPCERRRRSRTVWLSTICVSFPPEDDHVRERSGLTTNRARRCPAQGLVDEWILAAEPGGASILERKKRLLRPTPQNSQVDEPPSTMIGSQSDPGARPPQRQRFGESGRHPEAPWRGLSSV